jgi:hypothetical protein
MRPVSSCAEEREGEEREGAISFSCTSASRRLMKDCGMWHRNAQRYDKRKLRHLRHSAATEQASAAQRSQSHRASLSHASLQHSLEHNLHTTEETFYTIQNHVHGSHAQETGSEKMSRRASHRPRQFPHHIKRLGGLVGPIV